MAAVVRVKRRIDEEPLSAFIINCKRPRLDEDNVQNASPASKEEISTVVKFAGTLESPDEVATLQIAKLTKEEAKELATKVHKQPNIQDRNRQHMRERTQENRFKVVNCYRAVENSELIGDTLKPVTIVDVEKQSIGTAAAKSSASSSRQSGTVSSQSNGPAQASTSIDDSSQMVVAAGATTSATTSDESSTYVYDLYLADEADHEYVHNANLTDNYLRIRPLDDLVYEDYNDPYNDDNDSEDSNQENYFKNDYPDTDDDEDSFGVSDMRKAMEDLDGDYDLSSDDEQDCRNGFVYSIDSEAIGFEDDLDYCDVNRYGETYARYGTGNSRRQREAIYNDNESDHSDCKKSDDEE